MRWLWFWMLVLCSALTAADERRLALLRDAQASFDRVAHAASPQLADASACVQSQAATLSVALPAEQPDLHYRKGYCELAVAAVTRTPTGFTEAAAELERAGANMLAWIAREVDRSSEQPFWVTPDTCPASCQPFVSTAGLWLGWLALNRGNPDAAAPYFSLRPESGWQTFAAGMKAFQAGRYAEAAARYRETLDIWTRDQHNPSPPLALRLGPPADIVQLLAELGGAQLLSGDSKAAIATLDRAIQTAPAAKIYFLRARARELAGETEPALADYNLASRTAFASAADLASGEAHLYRGISFYRRQDFARAEEEFASALNFEIPPTLRPDASAWRHLAAVAGGSCGASRDYLERALAGVSPYFPKQEAATAAAGCPR